MHAILSHPGAMRYWSTPPHADLERTREWLADMIASEAEGEDFILEFEGRAIGKAGCWKLPEIGYILHPDYWGRGLAREALASIIQYIFATHPIEQIVADVDPRNQGSLNLLARLGFVETGRAANTWKVGDEWSDSVYLALRRPAR